MVEWLMALPARKHVPSHTANALAVETVEIVSSDDEDDAEAMPASAPSATPAIEGWNHARPLCSTTVPGDAAVSDLQLEVLEKARALYAAVWERMPPAPSKGSAAHSRDAAHMRDKGYVVHAESNGHVSLSMMAHPHAVAQGHFDIHFVDTWCADIVLRFTGIGTGFLPLFALIHEPDLVADYLPRASGLPYIERLEFEHVFAPNDWVYRCFVSPFGPLPGADDLHGITFYDLLDEPEKALMFYAESPKEGADEHRGWPVPKVSHWRRKRNYVLGATTLVTPSKAEPLELVPPGPKPAKCANPACTFYAHPVLSIGHGLYCCQKCHEKPGKHGPACQKCEVGGTGGAPSWSLPVHGTVDLELAISLKLPIPTFLIPLAFIRWVLIKLVKLVYPYLLALNERFIDTPFAQRVADDTDGFYDRLRATLNAPQRPWNRNRKPDEPRFFAHVATAGAAPRAAPAGASRPCCVLQDTVESQSIGSPTARG